MRDDRFSEGARCQNPRSLKPSIIGRSAYFPGALSGLNISKGSRFRWATVRSVKDGLILKLSARVVRGIRSHGPRPSMNGPRYVRPGLEQLGEGRYLDQGILSRCGKGIKHHVKNIKVARAHVFHKD